MSTAVHFEGFWQCRLSTDPDPTRERRGTSGYTFSVAGERDFDRKIRFQRDQIPDSDFREPFPPYLATDGDGTRRFGVYVTGVDGDPTVQRALNGAELRLVDGPEFELRNQIVGDGMNRIAPPIVPFHLQITRGAEVLLGRRDPLDPRQPHKGIWELRPDDFARRVPVVYRHLSDEVVETIFPQVGKGGDANSQFQDYFARRTQWLESRITAAGQPEHVVSALRTRKWAIEQHSGTGSVIGLIENRLGLQCIWEHEILGGGAVVAPALRGLVSADTPWAIRFWMGGWDGDLLVGYTRGTLTLPGVEAAR